MPSISVPGVTFTGPLFDGTSLRIVADMMKAVDTAMGDAGVVLLNDQFDANFQNPTGFYASQVAAKVNTRGVTIGDGGVVYGPWLEGTGSRNQTTRFKGYQSFRKATQKLDQAAEVITNAAISNYVRQLNG